MLDMPAAAVNVAFSKKIKFLNTENALQYPLEGYTEDTERKQGKANWGLKEGLFVNLRRQYSLRRIIKQ